MSVVKRLSRTRRRRPWKDPAPMVKGVFREAWNLRFEGVGLPA